MKSCGTLVVIAAGVVAVLLAQYTAAGGVAA